MSPLSSSTQLLTLYAPGNRITNLVPLAGKSLTTLSLQGQAAPYIGDLTPLTGMCTLRTFSVVGGAYACPNAVLNGLKACGVPVQSDCP